MEERTKVCHQCGQEKPFSEFYTARRRPDGKTSLCKVCYEAARKNRTRTKPWNDPYLKRCSCCGIIKPRTEFYRSKYEQDGLKKWCKTCKPALLAKKFVENAC